MHHLTSRRRAFSLIELAVVLIVIAVIAAIAIPTFQATIAASDESAAEAEVATGLRNAVAIARARGEFGAPSDRSLDARRP
jgi:prepilin-type N-terminal cleavage/methylation domain-containing protein